MNFRVSIIHTHIINYIHIYIYSHNYNTAKNNNSNNDYNIFIVGPVKQPKCMYSCAGGLPLKTCHQSGPWSWVESKILVISNISKHPRIQSDCRLSINCGVSKSNTIGGLARKFVQNISDSSEYIRVLTVPQKFPYYVSVSQDIEDGGRYGRYFQQFRPCLKGNAWIPW